MREIPYSRPPYHEEDPKKMENSEYLAMLRQALIERLVNIYTLPSKSPAERAEGEAFIEQLRAGEKVEAHEDIYGALAATGQDYWLTPDERDMWRKEIFTQESLDARRRWRDNQR